MPHQAKSEAGPWLSLSLLLVLPSWLFLGDLDGHVLLLRFPSWLSGLMVPAFPLVASLLRTLHIRLWATGPSWVLHHGGPEQCVRGSRSHFSSSKCLQPVSKLLRRVLLSLLQMRKLRLRGEAGLWTLCSPALAAALYKT